MPVLRRARNPKYDFYYPRPKAHIVSCYVCGVWRDLDTEHVCTCHGARFNEVKKYIQKKESEYVEPTESSF